MTEEMPFSPLVAQVITAQHEFTRQTTDRLVDSLQHQLAEARARADAVEAGVLDLLAGPYMPTPDAIRSALFPPKVLVAEYRKRNETGGVS